MNIILPGDLHLGRRTCIAIMEIEQVAQEIIKQLGMWNYDVFNEVYSQKLCLSGLKGVSGYDPDVGSFQNDRIDLPIATNDVLNMLWPNLNKLLQAAKAAPKNSMEFFTLFD